MPFRRRQLMLGEQVVVEEWQLDRIGDLLDLAVEPADVAVRDVGHLLQQQVFDLGTRQLLQQHVGARVEPHRVATAQVHPAQGVGELADPLLVGAADDQCAHAIVEELLDGDDLAGHLGMARLHDVEALVEHDLRSARQLLVIDVGMQPDTHLATAGEHVDRAVVVLADDHAVRGRRLGELVDLVAQRRDVLARLAQCVAQLLVLGHRLSKLSLGFQQALLERALALRCIGKAATELVDLLLEHGELRLQHRIGGVRILCHVRNLHARGTSRRALMVVPSPPVERDPYHLRRSNQCLQVADLYAQPGLTPSNEETLSMKVWIDQDLCTGDGLCEEIAPDVFTLLDDGLAYVREGDKIYATAKGNPQGAEGMASFPDSKLDAVIESAEECPGECIFIEP